MAGPTDSGCMGLLDFVLEVILNSWRPGLLATLLMIGCIFGFVYVAVH